MARWGSPCSHSPVLCPFILAVIAGYNKLHIIFLQFNQFYISRFDITATWTNLIAYFLPVLNNSCKAVWRRLIS